MSNHTNTNPIDRCELCGAEASGPDAEITDFGLNCAPCAANVRRSQRGFNPTTGWSGR